MYNNVDLKLAYTWVPRLAVCALQRGEGQTRFGGVPVSTGIKAHFFPADSDILEESITFCPLHFDKWKEIESSRTASGLHWRNLHVGIGESPTKSQLRLTNSLMALDDFKLVENQIRATKWLGDFLVSTLIHESTHASAFVDKYKTLSEYDSAGRRVALTG